MIHNSYSHIRFQKDCKALELNYYKKFMDLRALCPFGTEGARLRRRLCIAGAQGARQKGSEGSEGSKGSEGKVSPLRGDEYVCCLAAAKT
jgi:hypothetical protein